MQAKAPMMRLADPRNFFAATVALGTGLALGAGLRQAAGLARGTGVWRGGVAWRLVAVVFCAWSAPLPLLAAPAEQLFNGRNLEGWSGNPDIWSVQDGQIVGSTVSNRIAKNTFLVWQGGEVGDFRLNFKARMDGDNNSGVQYRSEVAEEETWKVIGYQADIHPKPEYTAMLYSEGTGRGIMAQRGQQVVANAKTGKSNVVGKTSDP